MAKSEIKSKPIRKPIHIMHNRRNARFNPEFLDCSTLLYKFTPLIQSLHKYFCSYCGILDQPSDCEDLYAQIQYEFLRLCHKYDPKRGVDFTGYIKFNLKNRVYYYVCKIQKYQTTEHLTKLVDENDSGESYYSQLQHIEDTAAASELEQVDLLSSIPWNVIPNELDRDIIYRVLVNHDNLEHIAKVRNLKVKVIKDRFNELLKLIKESI